jgi:ribonuclease D
LNLDTPRRPVVQVVDQESLDEMLEALKQNADTLAIDTERASGFRYSQRAYLVQIGLAAGSIYLIDPVALDDTSPGWNELVAKEINSRSWLLHAATQDIPCLTELGFASQTIIDTELAARLAGYEKVGLGSMVTELLDLELAKEHSASDWSIRPLQASLLNYAALDVDVLHDLWAEIEKSLESQSKSQWAKEEFASLQNFRPKPIAQEPWRNLPGLSRVKDQVKLKAAAALWLARNEIAIESDLAPGRLIPDRSIMAAIEKVPRSKHELSQNKLFQGRASRSMLSVWWEAIEGSKNLEILPAPEHTGALPNHKSWEKRFPEAHVRLKLVRELVMAKATELIVPVENLLTPEFLRRVCFEPEKDIAAQLRNLGARDWQIEITTELIEEGLELALTENSHPQTP